MSIPISPTRYLGTRIRDVPVVVPDDQERVTRRFQVTNDFLRDANFRGVSKVRFVGKARTILRA